MMKLKVNRKFSVDIDNIEKFVIKKDCIWVYRIEGYPKIYKTDYSAYMFRMQLTALGLRLTDFKLEYDQ